MKQIIVLFVCFAMLSAKAQTPVTYNPYPKTISVNGSAEMEIVPDEIYVQIDLREYKKKGESKTELDRIKSDFLAKCSSIGVPDADVSIASYEGSNYNYWYWKRRKKDPDMYAGISYQVKFKESKKMDQLIDILDDEATANFRIVKATHSKIKEYRKELKIQAIKAAKEKGVYLSEAVNERLGEAVTIIEPEENNSPNLLDNNNARISQYASNYSFKMMDGEKITTADNSANVDFKKIKLRYEVQMVFALK